MKELDEWHVQSALNRALDIAQSILPGRIAGCGNKTIAAMEQELLDDVNFIIQNDVVLEIMKRCKCGTFKAKQPPNGE
jgi:hypothetical protein